MRVNQLMQAGQIGLRGAGHTTRGDAIADTYRMIRDAGFEIEGNPLYEAGTESSNAFRLTGTDGEILKPEIARQS